MAQISVIVAVYKMPEFLPRCIDSILNQTFRDLELILVDDGSPDNCGEICDAYAARDARVKVIHKENAGVCVARNTGLDWVYANSDSQWIFFHDNDDWIHPETLERLLKAAQTLKTGIAICGYQLTEGEEPVINQEDLQWVAWKPEDFYTQRFINATVCWGKLYHRSVFPGKRYPEGKYVEDEFLTYQLLFSQEILAVIAAPLYAYFVNPAGISKKTWQPKRLDAWDAYEQQIRFFAERGNEKMVRNRYRGYLENALVNLAQAEKYHDRKVARRMSRKIKGRIRNVIARAWKCGTLDFQMDFDVLVRFYPLTTKVYRFYLEKIKK